MSKETLNVIGKVDISIRKFIEDPNGNITLENGKKGRYENWEKQKIKNLITTNGAYFLLTQMYQKTGIAVNGANYIALSTDSTTPDISDILLIDEIEDSGLERTQGSIGIVSTTKEANISNIFTLTNNVNNISKIGLFNQATSGILVHEALLDIALNLELGDQIRIWWIISFS